MQGFESGVERLRGFESRVRGVRGFESGVRGLRGFQSGAQGLRGGFRIYQRGEVDLESRARREQLEVFKDSYVNVKALAVIYVPYSRNSGTGSGAPGWRGRARGTRDVWFRV